MAVSGLLSAALAACGDPARWDRLTLLRARLRMGGLLLASKFKSPAQRPYTVEVSPREVRAVLFPFGRDGGRGVFTGDTVRIESAAGHTLLARSGARAHARDHLVWDDLDFLYFLGYALWNYLNTPFLFRWPGVRCEELAPWRDPTTGAPLRRLRVQFPPHLPTHCPTQVFYFDDRANLVRLDYCAEIFSRHLRGAHLCQGHRKWDCGLVFATHRRVVPLRRDLRPLLWAPAAMEGFIEDVQAE